MLLFLAQLITVTYYSIIYYYYLYNSIQNYKKVQNYTARTIINKRKFENITSFLKDFHLLLDSDRIS